MKNLCRMSGLLCCLALSFPLEAQERKGTPEPKSQIEISKDIDLSDLGTANSIDLSKSADLGASSKPIRFTLGHEGSFRPQGDQGIVNNRSWFRVEYSKFFLNSFFVQIDSKLNAFWKNDHRAKAEDKTVLFETNTPEAFLQYSGADGNTSIKVGVQRLIWGESEAGAITDEVSPRNFSELFFIPLEEARIGQFMASMDHFSPNGDWTVFFVPDPKFNKSPKPGTAYYFDSFNGTADIQDELSNKQPYEYGTRWKKTFGKSDISLMAASLIDNDYAYRMIGTTAGGRLIISRLKQRYTLTGVTGNYASGKYLLKGELAFKSPQAFNDSSFQLIRKDVIDSSLGLTYSLGQSNTVGLEVVNSHVLGWNSQIVGVKRDSSSLVLNASFFFLNDTLSVSWLTIYSRPFASYQSSIRTSYKWNDNTTLNLDAHVIDVPDKDSGLYRYRNQDQIFFRVQYQF